ncbi:MAG: hypothetical protein Q9Q40_05175 [Acidobacteriota bacterium]|nr:hypothetical protein [Acidobacteriota bacterium]
MADFADRLRVQSAAGIDVVSRDQSQRVFNPIPRRLLRRRITRAEAMAGGLTLLALLVFGAWILTRAEAYDPAERDIAFETLQQGSVADTLYRRPVRRWVDPGTPAAPTVDLGPFPPSLLEGGWTLDGRVETYTPENLYVKINGAAEQYLAFDFRRLTYLTLARGPLFLTIELYDQGRPAHALGLFARQRNADAPVLSEQGVHYTRTSVGALGMRGGLFFRIAASAPGPLVEAKTRQVLRLLAEVDRSGQEPDGKIVEFFTGRLGLPFEAVSYQKENVFQYDFLEDFWFASGLEKLGAGRDARIFVHQARDAGRAEALYRRLVAEQLAEYEPIEQAGEDILLRHRYLGTVFALARDGARLYGVEHAADRAVARALLARMQEAAGGD